MKEKFLEQIAKLIDLKSIVTLLFVITLMTAVLYCLFKTGDIPDDIRTVFVATLSSIITYFFTKKSSNDKTVKEEDKDANN